MQRTTRSGLGRNPARAGCALLVTTVIVAGCAQTAAPVASPAPTPAPIVTAPRPAPPPGPRFDPNLPRVGAPALPPIAAAPPPPTEPKAPPLNAPACNLLDLVEQFYQDRGPVDAQRTWRHFAPCLLPSAPALPANSAKAGAGREYEASYSADTPIRKLAWSEKRRYDYYAGADAGSLIRMNVNFERFCVKIQPIEDMRVKLAGSKAEIVRRPVYAKQLAFPPGYERISADRTRLVFYAIDQLSCVRGVILAHGATNFRFYPAAPPIKRMGAGEKAPP